MHKELLFDSANGLVWLAPFLGVFAAAFTRRRDPKIEGDRVLRHDVAAILEHWTHGIATAVLLGSGIALGVLFLPALLAPGQQIWTAMNIHFIAVVIFLFGTFYYVANTALAMKRLHEHLPTKDAYGFTKRHYGLLLGFKRFTMPPERKYFESEKMAYLMAAGATIAIIVSGLLKVLAHVVSVPPAVMAVATPAHDLATVVMLAFIVPHVVFAAILPSSWPIFRSMLTGYVSLDYARHEHAGWVAELESQPTTPAAEPVAPSSDRDAA